jgi:beta-lactamase class A
LLLSLGACGPKQPAGSSFETALGKLEQDINGRIGVYAIATGSGRSLGHRADERFAMASTFKVLLVAAVLAEVDAGRLSLADTFTVRGVEIQPYSPVVGELQPDEAIDLLTLCTAAVAISDNTATNMLLGLINGPEGLTEFLRAHGDSTTRLDRYEVELNTNLPNDDRDTTTPAAMAGSVQRLLLGNALSDNSRKLLQDLLKSSTTGLQRLRAGFPDDWQVGDKTGYGANGAVNDVAIAWPPGKAPMVIGVFMSDTGEGVDVLNGVHARIAALAVEQLNP